MKNVQIIDGATNCLYPVYAAADDEFALMFPNGQDVEFVEDFIERLGEEAAGMITDRLWSRPQDKKTIRGIHGTLFYGLASKKSTIRPRRKTRL